MKTTLIAALALGFFAVRACAGDASTLEDQLRVDIAEFVRAKAQQPIQKEAQAKMVDQMVASVKSSFPSVLIDAPKAGSPTDETLRQVLSDLDRVGVGAPRPVLISFYAELWKSERIGPQQRIIFERLARAITEAAANRKKNG